MKNALHSLPPDIGRQRVLNSQQAAQICGFSLPHWRRLYRVGKVPKPLQIGDRKLGWRAGDLLDWLAAKAAS
jgi:predicted DNA-binding transcriptional regulator AlpA